MAEVQDATEEKAEASGGRQEQRPKKVTEAASEGSMTEERSMGIAEPVAVRGQAMQERAMLLSAAVGSALATTAARRCGGVM